MKHVDYNTAKQLFALGYPQENSNINKYYWTCDQYEDITKEKLESELKPSDKVIRRGYWASYIVLLGRRLSHKEGDYAYISGENAIVAPPVLFAWEWLWNEKSVRLLPDADSRDIEECLFEKIKSYLSSANY